MSLAITPLNTFRVKEPRVKINEERDYAILSGGSQVSYKPVVSTSYSSASQQFSAPPPSPMTIVDRKVYLSVPVTLTFSGSAPVGQNLLQSGYDSFRAFPLSSVINTLQITLNNTSVSVNMSDTIQALLRYHNKQDMREFEYSMTPSMMDQSQNYADLSGTFRNPLGQYGDGYEMSRGGFPLTSLVNTNTGAIVVATVTEPLFLSPMLFGHGESAGFIGLQTMDFNITYNPDLTRMWSHSAGSGSTISTITVSFGQPKLLFTYITPKELQIVPKAVVYPYFSISRFPTDSSVAITPNVSAILSSASIQLNSIPRRMYIFARKKNADLTYNDTDTFLGITNVTINWSNQSGLLSSATQQDLYNISKENGCNLSWAQWSGGLSYIMSGGVNTAIGTVGSVLAIEFGKDIGLSDTEAPGLLGSYQLQMAVTVTNTNQTLVSITPSLYIVIVSEGTFTVTDQQSITQIGVISKDDVINSKTSEEVNYHEIESIYGSGSFFTGLQNFTRRGLSKVKKLTKQGLNAVETYVPKAIKAVETYSPKVLQALETYGPEIAKLVGAGEMKISKDGSLKKIGKAKIDMKVSKKGKGGAPVGGQVINRSQLMGRLM